MFIRVDPWLPLTFCLLSLWLGVFVVDVPIV
jgi:hypothetical protein